MPERALAEIRGLRQVLEGISAQLNRIELLLEGLMKTPVIGVVIAPEKLVETIAEKTLETNKVETEAPETKAHKKEV